MTTLHTSPLLKAATAGLQILCEYKVTPKARRLKARLVAVRGGTPVCETNLPGTIQEMLADYRLSEPKH
jgi:hypothetical protein